MSERMDARLREVLHLIAYLRKEGGKAHLGDVAAALGMSPKQTRDLIARATMCGKAPFGPDDMIELWLDKDWVYLALDQRLGRPIQFSRQEALALVIALRAVGREGDLGPAARSALDALRAALTDETADTVAKLESRVAFEGDDAGVAERFDTLRRGQLEGRAVDIEYYTASRDAMSRRRLRPFALLQHLGQWYAVGRDSKRHEIRMFKIERIKSAALTDERFEIPASFKAERYRKKGKLLVGRGHTEARVRFVEPAARVVREEWPPDLVDARDDGSVVGTLHFVAVEGVANWVLAHGGAAEVVTPQELRAAVAERARETLALYEQPAVDDDGIPYL